MAISSTSFKPGNRCSVGNKGGRPITLDREKIIKLLIEFSEKDDALTLGQFSADYCVPGSTVRTLAAKDPEFALIYSICRDRIGARREKLLHKNKLNYHSYNKYQCHFDSYLKYDQREDLEYESKFGSTSEAINEDGIADTLKMAKLEAENAKLKELISAKELSHESETNDVDIRSEQTPEHLVRSSQIGEDIQ